MDGKSGKVLQKSRFLGGTQISRISQIFFSQIFKIMRVWIVNYYTEKPERASNPRYLQFSKRFMDKGWEVTTFNANYQGEESDPLFDRKQYGEYDFVHVKAPHYVGNGLGRMKSIFSFAWQIYKHCKEFEKPDVILQNVHTPFDYPIVWAAKKLKAKYVAEAWDAWPDVFAHLGLVSRRNPALKVFYWIEKKLYQKADQVVFTIAGMIQHIKDMGWSTETGGKIDLSKVHYINNGVDLEQFDKDREVWPREDEDLHDPKTLKVVYLGSINRANHVHTLIDAAKLLQLLPVLYLWRRQRPRGTGAEGEGRGHHECGVQGEADSTVRVRLGGESGHGEYHELPERIRVYGREQRQDVPVSGGWEAYRMQCEYCLR